LSTPAASWWAGAVRAAASRLALAEILAGAHADRVIAGRCCSGSCSTAGAWRLWRSSSTSRRRGSRGRCVSLSNGLFRVTSGASRSIFRGWKKRTRSRPVAAVIDCAAAGELSIEEAHAFLRLIEQQRKGIETAYLAVRLELLEQERAGDGASSKFRERD